MPGGNHDDCLTAGHWTPRAVRENGMGEGRAWREGGREEDAAAEGAAARGKGGDDSGSLSLALPVRYTRYIYTRMAKRPARRRREPLVDTPSLIRIMVMAR